MLTLITWATFRSTAWMMRGERVRSVDVIDGGIGSDGAGPLQVEVGLDLETAVEAGIGAVQKHLGVVRRQVVARAEGANVANLDVGLADDGDALAGAVDARLVQRSNVVDGGKVFGRQVMRRAGIVGRVDQTGETLGLEIVEAQESAHHAAQGLGHRRLAGIGEMRYALDSETMDGSVQRPRHLFRGAAEGHPVPRPRGAIHGEALGGQPGDHLRVIARAQAEAVAELFRSQPLMKERRGGILLPGEQVVQFGLLRRGGFEDQNHVVHVHRRIDCALVVLGNGQAVEIAGDHTGSGCVYGARDAVRDCRKAARRGEQQQGQDGRR